MILFEIPLLMLIAILADQHTREEILRKEKNSDVEFLWPDSMSSLLMLEADCYFDLDFNPDMERTEQLRKLLPAPVFVGAISETLSDLGDARFIRLNSWPGMIARETLEVAFADSRAELVQSVFRQIGWKYISVPDTEGLVTPRILAMIINEAFFALEENISSTDQIDIAMKLGTGYPYGPFEWAEKIGLGNIVQLLKLLGARNSRYQISTRLTEAADPNFKLPGMWSGKKIHN